MTKYTKREFDIMNSCGWNAVFDGAETLRGMIADPGFADWQHGEMKESLSVMEGWLYKFDEEAEFSIPKVH